MWTCRTDCKCQLGQFCGFLQGLIATTWWHWPPKLICFLSALKIEQQWRHKCASLAQIKLTTAIFRLLQLMPMQLIHLFPAILWVVHLILFIMSLLLFKYYKLWVACSLAGNIFLKTVLSVSYTSSSSREIYTHGSYWLFETDKYYQVDLLHKCYMTHMAQLHWSVLGQRVEVFSSTRSHQPH